MRFIKASELKQKMVFVVNGSTFVAFKIEHSEKWVEIETLENGTGLVILQPTQAILILGEV